MLVIVLQMRQNLKFTIDVRLCLILTFHPQMKLIDSAPYFSSIDVRFAIAGATALALVVAFVLSIHLF